MFKTMKTIKATLHDLETVAHLFKAYREFYQQPSDIAGAKKFIEQRLTQMDSVIFLAIEENSSHSVGFTQLYPLFSSVKMSRIYLLNDLYVDPHYRKQGIGQALLKAAQYFALEQGATKIMLQTAQDNINAQKLYEAEGYQAELSFITYELPL
jgi:ribosomal protein S18 acetylase RimI-like enzyme